MVVLAVGPGAAGRRRTRSAGCFNISCGSRGLLHRAASRSSPRCRTFTDGVFLAGACQGPKDIPDTVAQAGAAAAEALALIDRGSVELEPSTAFVDADEVLRLPHLHRPLPVRRAVLRRGDERSRWSTRCSARAAASASPPARRARCQQHLFTDEQIFAELEGVLEDV